MRIAIFSVAVLAAITTIILVINGISGECHTDSSGVEHWKSEKCRRLHYKILAPLALGLTLLALALAIVTAIFMPAEYLTNWGIAWANGIP